MLLQSHMYLGNSLSNLIDKKYRNYFVLGNVTPDLVIDHKIKKHEYYYLKDWFLNYLDKTLEMKVGDQKLAYYRLGILTHYTADFFCRAHNDNSIKKKYVKHFSYEKRLHDELLRSDLNFRNSNNISLSKIDKTLEENHLRYREKEYNTTNDLVFIKMITTNMVRNASSYILANQTKPKTFYYSKKDCL